MSVYKSEKPEYLERSLQSIWDDQICKPNKIILVQDGPVGIDLTKVLQLLILIILQEWIVMMYHDQTDSQFNLNS